KLRDPTKFIQRLPVIKFQKIVFIHGLDVFHGDVHSVYAAQNRAAIFFQISGKSFDLGGGLAEKLIEFGAESRIVRRNGGQHSGMKKGIVEVLLDLANGLNDAGLEQRIQIAELKNLFFKRVKAAKNLNMLLGQWQLIGAGQYLDQGDFERRKRQGAV